MYVCVLKRDRTVREGVKTLLSDILIARKQKVEEARSLVPRESLERASEARHEFRDFAGALSGPGIRVIAELKQASPSRGVLRKDYHCREIAQAYEAAGAAALSVLTEEQFFHGSLTDMIDARDAVGLPVLRKDFLVDTYQVLESAAAGADALLLIVAALADGDLRTLIDLAHRLRMAALVEVHTEKELDRALHAGAELIGVNNRNLETFQIDLETSFRLRAKIPAKCLTVSESGIQTAADIRRLAEAGFNAVLIGEHLMAATDPGRELAKLLEGVHRAPSPRA
jgi:indole-3-glycerol phosphate synthase